MEELKKFPSNIIDSVVTDPPYGLSDLSPEKIMSTMLQWSSGGDSFIPKGKGFMNKDWDSFVPPPAVWKEVLRVLKPGGYILCFAGSRTLDLMSISLRLAGFEIRDTIMWLYGSGFPKSHNLKGEYEGLGTALKPAVEPIILARKPLEGTVLENVQKWGVGALRINDSRIGTEELTNRGMSSLGVMHDDLWKPDKTSTQVTGRWPANLLLDEESAQLLDEQSGVSKGSKRREGIARKRNNGLGLGSTDERMGAANSPDNYGDAGGASRFFYISKVSVSEREAGLENLEDKYIAKGNQAQAELKRGNTDFSRETDTAGQNKIFARKNHHPTVKPISLMTYLCKLVTPPKGTILDPFTGSGSTGIAAVLEDFTFIGIEQSYEYVEIAKNRIEYHLTRK